MLAVPAGDLDGVKAFDISQMARDQVVVDHLGIRVVLLQQGAQSLQLNLQGRPEGAVHLFVEAMSSEAAEDRKRLLSALADLKRLGRLRPERFCPYARGPRLRAVLRALDGHLAGASHRRIAIELFGQARVSAEWTDPRGHLRDVVRRAVARGRRLMTGGYRSLVA